MDTEPLKDLGLSESEIKIYVAGLKIGLTTVTSYAEKTNLPRTTTYDLLKALEGKGLAGYVIKSGVKHFSVVNPKELIEKLQEKEKNLKKILPELGELQMMSVDKPKVEFYQGFEGVKTATDDLVSKPNKTVCGLVPEQTIKTIPFFHMQFRRKRRERNVSMKLITETKPLMKEMQRKDKEELRESRFLNKIMKDSNTALFVYDNKVSYLILTEKEQLGVIIEHKNIADLQRKIFEELWSQAKKS